MTPLRSYTTPVPVVELVDLDLCAGVREQAEPRIRVPRAGFHLVMHEMSGAVPGLGTRWTVDDQRLDAAAGPASNPDLREVADMIGMEMGGEIGRDVLMRDLERGEIHLRSRPEI